MPAIFKAVEISRAAYKRQLNPIAALAAVISEFNAVLKKW